MTTACKYTTTDIHPLVPTGKVTADKNHNFYMSSFIISVITSRKSSEIWLDLQMSEIKLSLQIILLINQLLIWAVNSQKIVNHHFQGAQVDVFKLLILYDQQSQT